MHVFNFPVNKDLRIRNHLVTKYRTETVHTLVNNGVHNHRVVHQNASLISE